MLAGFVNELAKLITDSKIALEHPFFQGVLRNLAKSYRESWSTTVHEAIGTNAQGSRFGRLVYFARNKVGFHYDPKEIARGYRRFFVEKGSNQPCISRADDMAGTRFYFADAAAEDYLMYAAAAKDA